MSRHISQKAIAWTVSILIGFVLAFSLGAVLGQLLARGMDAAGAGDAARDPGASALSIFTPAPQPSKKDAE